MGAQLVDALTDKCILMSQPMKSGSTLVSRMLSAHPSIAMTYDAVNFFRFSYQKYNPITDNVNIQRLFDDMAYRLYNRFKIELDIKQCMDHMQESHPSYGQAYLSILRTLLPDSGKTILGDKEPLAWTKIPDFLSMFPNGKAIITVRDPRDVVISFKAYTNSPGNNYLIALFNVIDAVNHAIRFRAQYPGRVFMIEFSRLKLEPEGVMRDVCEFLEIEYVPSMIKEENFTDMSGNVWEWMADWYDLTYYERARQNNPKGPKEGQFKLVRGGSWVNNEDVLHSAFRRWSRPEVRFNDTGFRCAKDDINEIQAN